MSRGEEQRFILSVLETNERLCDTVRMKLTAQVKLKPTPHQHALLKATLERANAACNYLSEYAWAQQVFGQYALHNALYKVVRAQFGLTAQVVVRCIAKVADAYKVDQKTKRVFREHGALPYDSRILRYYTDKQQVSIWTLPGRETIPYACGERQAELLKHQQGESDLVYHRGEWYLLATCDLPDTTPPDEIDGYLGIDRGVVNLAVDSDGNTYQGDLVEARRQFYARRRAVLQQVGTKSAKRALKRIRGRQARFQKHVNHCIAKELVIRAERTKRGLVLEDLQGIRLRTRVGRDHRARLGNWGFDQLGQFIEYKARLYGVPVRFVDPAYTSQRCSVCGHIDKANRRSQSSFLCTSCGHTAHADHNAAVNLALMAAVNQPQVSASPPARAG